jgi:hypothetical protein
MTSEICARDRLVTPNQIKDDAAIDVTRRLTGGNLEIG